MKVLFVLTYYWPHRTGLTLHAQYIAEALAARGHEVTILTSHYLDSLPRDQMLNGVRVVRIRSALKISRGQVMPGLPYAAYLLLKEHDVVSLHSPMLETALLARMARKMNRGVVITHHGDLVLPTGVLNTFISAAMLRLFHVGASVADHIIAYSDDYAEHSVYVSPHIAKTTALYPPVLLPEPSEGARQRVRKTLGADSHALIGYSGRFVEEKRPDLLLRALTHLDGMLPDARVAFAGQYIMPYEKFYQRSLPLIQRYEDRVKFLGLIEDPHDLADFYAACDVLVLPSSTECFGLVQVESMLSGTPVIATDITGAREPVRVTGMGEIVPPRDTLALAKAIARVASKREQYVKPREEIERIFNFSKTLQGYEHLLADAAHRSGRG
jgi:glycosyltransferase involved in cell wall biosynthesis